MAIEFSCPVFSFVFIGGFSSLTGLVLILELFEEQANERKIAKMKELQEAK